MASALANFRQELALFESLSAADPKDVQARRNRSLAHKQIGDVLMHTDQVRGALAQYQAALDIDRDLASLDTGNSQADLDLSFSEAKIGAALAKLGQAREGLTILRRGAARQESLLAKDPHHILLYNHLANSYTLLANILLNNADTKGAIEYYRKAVTARLTLEQKSPHSISNRGALAACYANLAKALGPSSHEDALKQYSTAIELLEQLTAADRSNVHYRVALAGVLSNTALLYERVAAQINEPASRVQYWTKARSFYQRSRDSWLELGKSGKLLPTQRDAIREVSGKLARCNDSLARLQPAH